MENISPLKMKRERVPTSLPQSWLRGPVHLRYQQWNGFFLLVAVIVYAFAFPLHRAKTFEIDWMAFVILRPSAHRPRRTMHAIAASLNTVPPAQATWPLCI